MDFFRPSCSDRTRASCNAVVVDFVDVVVVDVVVVVVVVLMMENVYGCGASCISDTSFQIIACSLHAVLPSSSAAEISRGGKARELAHHRTSLLPMDGDTLNELAV